jgi:hypothetical protein
MKKWLRILLIFICLYFIAGLIGTLINYIIFHENLLFWLIYWPLLIFWTIAGQYGEGWIIALIALLISIGLLFWLPFVIDKKWFGKK